MSPASARGLQLDVGYALARAGVPAPRSFRRWAEAALRGAGADTRACALAVRVVDEIEGRALNAQYRARDYATNVLSFPAAVLPGVPVRPLGDLVLCAPVVAHEAQVQGKPLNAHYAHLTVHGVLHLLGYDHQDEAEAAAMEALETRILAALGLPDPYLIG